MIELASRLLKVADRLEDSARHTEASPIEDVGTVWADIDEVITAQLEIRDLAKEVATLGRVLCAVEGKAEEIAALVRATHHGGNR